MTIRIRQGLVIAAAGMVLASPARALPPDQLFERVSPSVWSVKTYTDDEKLLTSASGVVVAPGKIVTSCLVLARAKQVRVLHGNAIFNARLEFPDVERDLCELEVAGLQAPALSVGSARGLRPGQRLYVVGFARGNGQSIGEGLVSMVADEGSARERLLTTVPASEGLRGAGVFDDQARLVGVVTVSPKDAAASVAAVPSEWLTELAARGKAALAARSAAASASATRVENPGLPATGTQWVYSYNERIFSKGPANITVRVLRSEQGVVEEAVTASSGDAKEARRVISTERPAFAEFSIRPGSTLVELAPYLLAANGEKPPGDFQNPPGYPMGASALPGWKTRVFQVGWETAVVPAGKFRTYRIKVTGKRVTAIGGRANAYDGQFEMDVWYAPDAKRIVRLEHKTWDADGFSPKLSGHQVIELVSYRGAT